MVKSEKIIEAAAAAIDAAVAVAGPTIEAGELISGILSIVKTHPTMTKAGADQLSSKVSVDLYLLRKRFGVKELTHRTIDKASAPVGWFDLLVWKLRKKFS